MRSYQAKNLQQRGNQQKIFANYATERLIYSVYKELKKLKDNKTYDSGKKWTKINE